MKILMREEQERERNEAIIQSFHLYYQAQYGDRWHSLSLALKSDTRSSCLFNSFSDSQVFAQLMTRVSNVARLCFLKLPVYGSADRFPQPQRDSESVYSHYLLDAASVLVTEALQIEETDKVLDMCAAPGGKSLAILQQLSLPRGSLTANEFSNDRRKRLWKVLTDYLPEGLRPCVRVTGRDGTRWWEEELYDKVLVDAPCSSEQHLLHNVDILHSWTEKRSAKNAKRQLALLGAALRSVRVGGLVVYSTCSISNLENDGVISKAQKKLKVAFEVVHGKWTIGEATQHGWIVLPDVAQGWGPLYFATLRRTSSLSSE